MKKIIITSLFLLGIITQNSFGQLRIDSVGRVKIGDGTSTVAQFSNLSIYPSFGKRGLHIKTNNSYGLTINCVHSSSSSSTGIELLPDGSVNTNHYVALRGYTGVSSDQNIAICGMVPPIPTGATKVAAIYGSSSSSEDVATGVYAGYFNGNVRVTGQFSAATIMTPAPNSIGNGSLYTAFSFDKDNETISDKLANVNLLQILKNTKPNNQPIDLSFDPALEELMNSHPEYSSNLHNKKESAEQSTIHYALAADELRESFPELVSEDLDGNVSINYIEMVPLLVQSIKELKAQIEELQGNDVKAVRNRAATSVEDTEADLFSVSQNEPNPFTESTTIKLSIPKKTQAAALIIYDMSGKQIKQININERGKISVNITSEGLAAGMYLYSLIADGKVINTKRMILTR